MLPEATVAHVDEPRALGRRRRGGRSTPDPTSSALGSARCSSVSRQHERRLIAARFPSRCAPDLRSFSLGTPLARWYTAACTTTDASQIRCSPSSSPRAAWVGWCRGCGHQRPSERTAMCSSAATARNASTAASRSTSVGRARWRFGRRAEPTAEGVHRFLGRAARRRPSDQPRPGPRPDRLGAVGVEDVPPLTLHRPRASTAGSAVRLRHLLHGTRRRRHQPVHKFSGHARQRLV